MLPKWLELALQFGRYLVRDRGDAKNRLRSSGKRSEQRSGCGKLRDRALQPAQE